MKSGPIPNQNQINLTGESIPSSRSSLTSANCSSYFSLQVFSLLAASSAQVASRSACNLFNVITVITGVPDNLILVVWFWTSIWFSWFRMSHTRKGLPFYFLPSLFGRGVLVARREGRKLKGSPFLPINNLSLVWVHPKSGKLTATQNHTFKDEAF